MTSRTRFCSRSAMAARWSRSSRCVVVVLRHRAHAGLLLPPLPLRFRSAAKKNAPAISLFDSPTQERAAAYLDGLKQSSDCWRLCVERFSPSGYGEVKFWCLQTLHEVRRRRVVVVRARERCCFCSAAASGSCAAPNPHTPGASPNSRKRTHTRTQQPTKIQTLSLYARRRTRSSTPTPRRSSRPRC